MSFINERFCEPCSSAPCPGLPDAAMTRRDYFFVCDGLRTPTLLTTLPALASAFPSAILARLGGLFWLIFFLRSLLVGQNPSALYSPAAAVVFFPVCCGDSIRSYPHNLYIPFPNTQAFSCIPYRRSLDCTRDIGNWLTAKGMLALTWTGPFFKFASATSAMRCTMTSLLDPGPDHPVCRFRKDPRSVSEFTYRRREATTTT